MVALTDAVQARVSTQRLIQLTNQDDTDASAIDTTVLDAACTDAIAEFELLVGRTYDDTDDRHVAATVIGVVYKLIEYKAGLQEVAYQEKRAFEERCKLLRTRTYVGFSSSADENKSKMPAFSGSSGMRPDIRTIESGDEDD